MNYRVREKIIWLVDLIAGVLTLAYILLRIGWESGGKWRLFIVVLVAIVIASIAYFVWPKWPYWLVSHIPWGWLEKVVKKWFVP